MSCRFLLHQFGVVYEERLSCNFLRKVIVSLPTKFRETHGHFDFITSYGPNRYVCTDPNSDSKRLRVDEAKRRIQAMRMSQELRSS